MGIKAETISDQIRAAIASSGLTRYEISKQTGIQQSNLSRFVSGQTALSTTTVDKLGKLLGLQIVVKKKRK